MSDSQKLVSQTTDPLPDEPHHTRCPAYNGRWCYREACDSGLGCIEFRRGRSQTTVKLTPMEQAMMWERMSGERLSDAERDRITQGGECCAHQPVTDEEVEAELAADGCCGGGVGPVPYSLCIDCPRRTGSNE